MKQACRKFSVLLFAAAFLAPVTLLAQNEEKEKEKEKGKKDAEQIIITRKGEKLDKMIIEIEGEKIKVNGKNLEDLKDDDISVRRSKSRDVWAYADGLRSGSGAYRNMITSVDSNRAMLGVTTEKTENGIRIQNVTKGSGAEKAGLKEGDIITRINDTKIEDPDDLSTLVKKHKPGEKLALTYQRDKKEQKATAELGKWKGSNVFVTGSPNFNIDLSDMNMGDIMPRIQATPYPRAYGNGQNWSWSGGSGPKLGLSVQDTDDGKGVKVIEVDDESNAQKAGVKEDDIITEVDGKVVNSADEVAKIIRDSKEKVSVMVKLNRAGKSQNIEVKMPRKLKTADL